eukprot:363062-Chlamydomonas_euryale.AAC.19
MCIRDSPPSAAYRCVQACGCWHLPHPIGGIPSHIWTPPTHTYKYTSGLLHYNGSIIKIPRGCAYGAGEPHFRAVVFTRESTCELGHCDYSSEY